YTALERILKSYGFEKDSDYGFFRIRDLNKPVHNYIIPEGFKIRSIKGKSEYGDYARAIREVFGHGEWFNAGVVEELDSNSYYNQDLDLIVEAPNGDIASFCTFRMDPITRITELEPMGTVPRYRKLGLGLAILGEGFKKLEKYDPSLLYIGGAANNPGANKLYEATDFIVKGIFYKWIKNI
ncbi:MAG: GNAT family N-acetyltransferase, partial [Candidatus Thorarchaeota archaeon]